jgi:hypothetical protein
MFNRVFETPPDGHYFFGYYDKSPLDAGGTRLLAQRAAFINRMPKTGESIEVGFFDFPSGAIFKPLAETSAWNWEQGSMLQWLGPEFGRRILYNDIRDGYYRAVVRDLETGSEQVFSMAAYTVSSDGKWGLCVDYDRLYWYRPGYNYQGPPRPEKRKPYDPTDGIWRMSLDDGALQKIISIEDVVALGPVSSMKGATHYLEHLMINPANSRFAFLHRWLNVDGGIVARLITADPDGGNLFVLNDSGRMSHFCWRDDETVFGFGGTSTAFNKLRRQKAIAKHFIKPLLPLYHRFFPAGGAVSRQVTGDCYQVLKDRNQSNDRIERSILPDDGHPTFRPGSRSTIINDTYPNNSGDCRLYLFDVNRREILAETTVASDPRVRATGYRCDLHPKWSFDGCYVAIDTISIRGRGIHVYAIEENLTRR